MCLGRHFIPIYPVDQVNKHVSVVSQYAYDVLRTFGSLDDTRYHCHVCFVMIVYSVVSRFSCRNVSYSEGVQYTRQFPLIVLTLHDSVSFRQGTRDGQFIVDWNFSGPPHSLVILCRNILVLMEDNAFLSLMGVPIRYNSC